jgi:molecular chaperone Hsp33
MQELDNTQRFIFEHADIRGEIIHLNRTYQRIMAQTKYPPKVAKLVAEACLAAVMTAASIKFEGQISIQFNGNNAFPLLLAKCTHDFKLRAMAKFNPEVADDEYLNAFLNGHLTITIEQDRKNKNYQSIVPIISESLSESLEHYFAQSEQVSTKIFFAVGKSEACGMLLQLMPGDNDQNREEFWQYAVKIGETITQQELAELDNETILYRLYHETELRLFTAKPISFECTCSKEKMQALIRSLGKEEAQAIIQERGSIDISCEFCHSHYSFDEIDVTLIFK